MSYKFESYIDKIDDYYYENIYGDFLFLKKGALFIAELLPMVDLSKYPFDKEAIEAQIKNVKTNNDAVSYEQRTKELKKKAIANVTDFYKEGYFRIKEEIFDLILCLFVGNTDPHDESAVYYAAYHFRYLGVPEKLLIEKLEYYFGDIVHIEDKE